MKSGINIRKVLNKLNEIDFNIAKDRHAFGELYESILKELQSAGKSGEFYTPRAVIQFITDMVNPQMGEIVLDPACTLSCAGENRFFSLVSILAGRKGCTAEAVDSRQQTVNSKQWTVLRRDLAPPIARAFHSVYCLLSTVYCLRRA